MAVQRRQRFLGSQRLDVPHIRSIESGVSSDFDELLSGLVTGPEGLIVRGFELNWTGAIGSAASGLQMLVASSMILHPTSRQSGTFLKVPSNASPEILNPTINDKIRGQFTPGAINYVGIEYERIIDDATSDTVYFWNPTSKTEFSSNIPLASILNYSVVITTSVWAANVLPICTVDVDVAGNVSAVTDQREMLGRLGKAGRNTPDPSYVYPWSNHPEGRTENPPSSSSSGVNPFHGGDKQLYNVKEILDAIFSNIKEIKGTGFWYSENTGGSLVNIRRDLGNTVVTGRGYIGHDGVIPGQINWNEDIYLTTIGSRLSYRLNANPTPGTDITLADGQVAYLELVRDVVIAPNLIFVNGNPIVVSVGGVGWTADLVAGDWIKVATDDFTRYLQIQSVDSLSQVTLSIPYPYASTGASGAQSQYTFGVYETNPAPSTDRHIQIANREDVPFNDDTFWFLLRDDNAAPTPRVYVRFIGSELEQGEDREISDNTTLELLQYIGSPNEAAFAPDYDSENYVTDGESLTSAIGTLDEKIWQKSAKLLGGGTLSLEGLAAGPVVLIDQSGLAPEDGELQLDATIAAISNEFTLASARQIDNANLYLRTNVLIGGAATMFLEIRDDVAGVPGNTVFATSDNVPVNTLLTTFSNINFTFSSPPTLPAGTYHIVLTGTVAVVNSNRVRWGYDNGGGRGGYRIGSTWLPEPYSFIVEIYGNTIASSNLAFSEPLYLETLGLSYSANQIPTLASPISFVGTQAAYVTPNLVEGGPALTVTVDSIENVPKNSVVIARSTSKGVVVSGMLLKAGEKLELDGALAEINRRLSQLRLRLHETDADKARIDTSEIEQLDLSVIGQAMGDLLLRFNGAVIDFTTGQIFEADGVTALGINFTPFAVPANHYFWYGISLVPGTVDATNRQLAQVQIDLADSSNLTENLAPYAVVSGDVKVGSIQVFNNAGNIEVSDVFRFGIGTGSGGEGDANELLERIKEKFADSSYEFVTPVIFAQSEEDLVDTLNSTGSYSPANKTYDLDPSEVLTTVQLFDDEYLALEKDLDRVEIIAFWKPDAVDEDAVYEVTRDGLNYQTVEMERVGNTDTYRGTHFFDEEADVIIVNGSDGTGGSSSEVLNNTTIQSIAQPFSILTPTKVIEAVNLIPFVRIGNPQGSVYFEISRDNGGIPGEVVATSAFIPASSIPALITEPFFPIGAVLAPGNYHFEIKTTQEYKDAFNALTAAITFNQVIGGPLASAQIFDGVSYTLLGAALRFRLLGRPLILKARVTAGLTGGEVAGLGVYYGLVAPVVSGVKSIERFVFSGDDDVTEFTINKFKPNPDFLKVYDVKSGLTYRFGAFSISGNKVVFSPGQFLSPGEQIDLIFDQAMGGGFDNSDDNANLLSENRLGSEDPTLDRSAPGEGILLKSTNGKLVEVSIHWNGTSHEIRLAEKP